MENVIIIVIVAAAAAFLGYRAYRSVSRRGCEKGCGGDCKH